MKSHKGKHHTKANITQRHKGHKGIPFLCDRCAFV
jgi:hypothetical protein